MLNLAEQKQFITYTTFKLHSCHFFTINNHKINQHLINHQKPLKMTFAQSFFN